MDGQEILVKVKAFNSYNEGKVHQQMVAEELDDGSIHIRGPLRIYWGLHNPIQLMQCDDIPPPPVSQWRHSMCVGPTSPAAAEPKRPLASHSSFKQPKSPIQQRSKDLDDILTAPSSPDDVIRRKKGVRKFKTVAYRGDQPTRWKRASINGHIFNYDTSVFTPVLGSCTCVNIHGNMNSSDVIETLLNKFKVQNSPDEYVLSVLSDGGERILSNLDKPLIDRLILGPDEVAGKLFIKEREAEGGHDPPPVVVVEAAIVEESLPEEVEKLLVLPEAALKQILIRYQKDEARDVKLLQARYNVARNRIHQRLTEISNVTTSFA